MADKETRARAKIMKNGQLSEDFVSYPNTADGDNVMRLEKSGFASEKTKSKMRKAGEALGDERTKYAK